MPHDSTLFVLPILAWLVFCGLVARAASLYHRNPGAWFFLAMVLSPLIAFAFLIISGDAAQAVALSDKEERLRQRNPERENLPEAVLNEMNCPECGAEVNPVTGDGLHTGQMEPWLLICNQCKATITPDV